MSKTTAKTPEIFKGQNKPQLKLELLKDDLPPEKFAEIKKQLNRLEEKSTTRRGTKNKEVQLFAEITEEMKRTLGKEIELINLIAQGKNTPELKDLKFENLAESFPSFFNSLDAKSKKEIREDWSVIWKNAKNISTELKNPNFDISNSKTWSLKNAGETIRDFTKKEPAAAIALALGGIAVISLLCKKWKTGTLLGSLGLFLGFSDWGKLASRAIIKKTFGFSDKEMLNGVALAKEAKLQATRKIAQKIAPQEKSDKPKTLKKSEFDKHTRLYLEKLQKSGNPEYALTYEALREQIWQQKNSFLPSLVSLSSLEETAQKIENGEQLSKESLNFWWNKLFVGLVVQISETGAAVLSLGGYFVYKIAKEDALLYKNFTKWFFKKDVNNLAELTQQYSKNALYVGACATAWDYLKNIGNHNKSILTSLQKGVKYGSGWPVYSVRLAGEKMVDASKGALNNKYSKYLGKWQWQKNTWNFLDKSGKVLAKFNPLIRGLYYLKKGGKWILETSGKTVGINVTKKSVVETIKKIPKPNLKTLRQKLIAIFTKGSASKKALTEILKLLPKSMRIAAAGVASLGSMAISAFVWDLIFPEEVGAFNKTLETKKISILDEELRKKDFQDPKISWAIMRKDSWHKLKELDASKRKKIAEAIHATNKRIAKELPKTPLFEIPLELTPEA